MIRGQSHSKNKIFLTLLFHILDNTYKAVCYMSENISQFKR